MGKAKPKLGDDVLGHRDFTYRAHKQWGDLDPGKTPVNNCHEMIMDNAGRLIMVGDETKNNSLIYDKAGKLLDSWGTAFTGGHGLTHWDAGGEEFMFISDTAGAVIKTTLSGRELLRIEKPSS